MVFESPIFEGDADHRRAEYLVPIDADQMQVEVATIAPSGEAYVEHTLLLERTER